MSVQEIVREAEATIERLNREAKRERFLAKASKVEWLPATKDTRLTGLSGRGRVSVSVELPKPSRTRPKRVRRNAQPVTITDKFGRVRVVSGETFKPKRGRKGKKGKQPKATYRLSEQVSRGVSGSFDMEMMHRIGTIHAEH